MATVQKAAPDYRIKEWTYADFASKELPDYVKEAISLKKWAFAADYLRLYILYHEGGIYLDSDVCLLRSFDEFLNNRFFTFMEYHKKAADTSKQLIDASGKALTEQHVPGICIQAAAMGAEKGHPFLKACMDHYENRHYLRDNGTPEEDIIAPDIYALCARDFGFRYIDKEQLLDEGMHIYGSALLAGSAFEIRKGCCGIHACQGSWRNKALPDKLKTFLASTLIKAYVKSHLH